MIDIKFLRENPDVVKENIKKKFQDEKLPLVDEVIELDAENRKSIQRMEFLRAERNKYSKQIGALMDKATIRERQICDNARNRLLRARVLHRKPRDMGARYDG